MSIGAPWPPGTARNRDYRNIPVDPPPVHPPDYIPVDLPVPPPWTNWPLEGPATDFTTSAHVPSGFPPRPPGTTGLGKFFDRPLPHY